MRFVVIGLTGFSPSASNSKANPQTSYSVLDTAYNYREVRQFYVTERGPRPRTQRARAYAAAAELNERYDAA